MIIKSTGKKLLILFLVIVISFIGAYAGRFLFLKPELEAYDTHKDKETDVGTMPARQKKSPISYKNLSETINGNKQEINILEVDLRDEKVQIIPALSHDRLFGFEKLSGIALRSSAYAAVNGGFFHEYGYPSGMVAINGEIITRPTGKYPVFMISGRKAALKELEMGMWVEYNGRKLNVDEINSPGKPGSVVLYTPAYGWNNRAEIRNISVGIEDGLVVKTAEYKKEANIPELGMLLTFFAPYKFISGSIPLKEGDTVHFKTEPSLESDLQAYECGSWIVKNGEIIIGDTDEWVGVMTNRDPRTVVGLKDDSTVILLTVDGRQPEHSIGLTGKELGRLLLNHGIKNAAMLDGGASTQMIVQNKIVNKPSFKGQERPLGGALIIRFD